MNEVVSVLKSNLSNDEALIVESIPNRFYITGFDSSDGFVYISNNRAVFLIDSRYVEKAQKTVKSCEVVLSVLPLDELKDLLLKDGVKTVYIETESVSLDVFKKYKDAFCNIVVSSEDKFDVILKDLRSVKSEKELSLIKKAQKLTDETFNYILNRISIGRTEKEIMLDMEFFMRKNGADAVAFDFIVVSGKNSSLPHGVPTDKKIEKGDFLTMDFGATVDGYRSDMTRTVAVGCVSDEQKKIYDIVFNAQQKAIDKIKSGMVCKDIDSIAREYISKNGYKENFGHGLGHSVGIEIHERPNFNTRCDTVLKPGTVMTVEPGIYLPDKFGVRIEDMVYVTDDGCINLTKSPKNLLII